MTTVLSGAAGVYRKVLSSSDGDGSANAKNPYTFLPDECNDFTVFAIGTSTAAIIVEESFSDPSVIADDYTNTHTNAVWTTLDATLASVGATGVVFNLGTHTCVAIRARQLTSGKIGSVTLVGKRL
jgi:hypothetical protein